MDIYETPELTQDQIDADNLWFSKRIKKLKDQSNLLFWGRCSDISITRDVVSGSPVFHNSRLPIRVMFEYISRGESLNDFLDSYGYNNPEKRQRLSKQIDGILDYILDSLESAQDCILNEQSEV